MSDFVAKVLIEVRKIFSKYFPKSRGHADLTAVPVETEASGKRAEAEKAPADHQAADADEEIFDDGENGKEAEAEAEQRQAEESARRDVFSLDAFEQEDHDDYEEMLEYVAEDDETPRLIAKKLGVHPTRPISPHLVSLSPASSPSSPLRSLFSDLARRSRQKLSLLSTSTITLPCT